MKVLQTNNALRTLHLDANAAGNNSTNQGRKSLGERVYEVTSLSEDTAFIFVFLAQRSQVKTCFFSFCRKVELKKLENGIAASCMTIPNLSSCMYLTNTSFFAKNSLPFTITPHNILVLLFMTC